MVRQLQSQRRWSETRRDVSWRDTGSRDEQRQSEEREVIRDGQRQLENGGLIGVGRREARVFSMWSKRWAKMARGKKWSGWWE